MWSTPIGRLRAVALVEGVSFLVLLGIAMPLKYLADMPMAVKVVGWAHGALFILLCGILAHTKSRVGWSIRQAAVVVIAALLPFGPFVIDGRLKRQEQARADDPDRG